MTEFEIGAIEERVRRFVGYSITHRGVGFDLINDTTSLIAAIRSLQNTEDQIRKMEAIINNLGAMLSFCTVSACDVCSRIQCMWSKPLLDCKSKDDFIALASL